MDRDLEGTLKYFKMFPALIIGIVRKYKFGMVTRGGESNSDPHDYEQERYTATSVAYCVLELISCVTKLTWGTWLKEVTALNRSAEHLNRYWKLFDPLMPNDPSMGRTASLTSRRCILYIYSTDIRNECFKHAAHCPFFSLQIAVYFIMLPFLVPLLFTF